MSTPTYQGSGQPAVASGAVLGSLGGLLGTSTPAYVGDGQPSSVAAGGIFGGFFGSATLAYQPAPAPSTTSSEAPAPCPEMDPDPFGSGPIAIVIRRQG